MIAEQVFQQWLNLGEWWEVRGIDYEAAANRFVLVIAETEKLWPTQVCPRPECGQRPITCYSAASSESW